MTGADDNSHLANLAEVLERLEKHGIRMKQAKSRCMQNSVGFHGHSINAEGLHTTLEKLEAIVNAPTPTNISHSWASLTTMASTYPIFLLSCTHSTNSYSTTSSGNGPKTTNEHFNKPKRHSPQLTCLFTITHPYCCDWQPMLQLMALALLSRMKCPTKMSDQLPTHLILRHKVNKIMHS